MAEKCGKHGHIGIQFCECKLASLRKENEGLRDSILRIDKLVNATTQASAIETVLFLTVKIGDICAKALAMGKEKI